jgi:hypothetical protein
MENGRRHLASKPDAVRIARVEQWHKPRDSSGGAH